MKYFSKISKQTLWQILGKVVTSFSTFIILGLVTRNFGKEGTGVFTLALTYLAIFYLLADFGFNAHVLSRVQGLGYRVQKEWHKLFGTRIIWSMVLVVTAVLLLPFLPFATPAFTTAVLIGCLAIVGSGIFTTCNLVFQSKLRYDLSVLASSLGTLISLPVFILLSINKSPVAFLLLAHLVGWFLIAAVAVILIRILYKNFRPVFDLHYSINLFKESWFIAATLALNVVYFRADSFMVAYFKSVSDAGVYNVAYSVFQSVLVLPTFIMNAYYPLMLRSVSGIWYMVAGLLGISFFGILITVFTAPLIIKILTGSGFGDSVSSLQILSLGFPAYFLSSLLMWLLIAKGNYKPMFLLYTSGTLVNIILNFIFIPKYSFFASSWITVFSEYFILGLQIMVLCFGRKRQHSGL